MDPVEHDTDFVWKQSSGGRIPFWPMLKWGGLAGAVAFVVWQVAPAAVPAISQFAEAFFQERAATVASDDAEAAEQAPATAEASPSAVPESMVDAPSGAAATPWAEVEGPGSGETDAASGTLPGEPLPQSASPIREVGPDGDAVSGRDSFSAEPAEAAPSAAPDPAGKADGYWNGSSFN